MNVAATANGDAPPLSRTRAVHTRLPPRHPCPTRFRCGRGVLRRSVPYVSSTRAASATSAPPAIAASNPPTNGSTSIQLILPSGCKNGAVPRGGKAVLRSRVRLDVYSFESLDAGMRVDLRRGNRRVSEQLLDGAQIGAGVEQMRGERMTKRVNRQAGILVNLTQ